MLSNHRLLKRIQNLEKKLPKPSEDVSYLIEVNEDCGHHYKILNGERIAIEQIPKFKEEDNITIKVTIVDGENHLEGEALNEYQSPIK